MTTHHFILLTMFIGLLLAGTSDALLADPPALTVYDRFQEQLTESRNTFDKWSLNGTIIVTLTFLTAIFGAVSGWLHQRDDKAKGKRISVMWKVAIALCVTIFTAVNSTLFEADHRTYWRLSDEGHDLAWKIDVDLASYQNASDEDRQEFFQGIQENFAKVQELKRSLHDKKAGGFIAASHSDGVFTSVALASGREPRPSWVTRLPNDYGNIYCVGVDYDNSIKLATVASLEDAKRNCTAYLIVLFESMVPSTDSGAKYQDIANFIVSSRSVRVADTYYEYDQSTKRYTYYTLLQIQRELAQNDIAFFTETKQQSSMRTGSLGDIIMKARGLPEDFYWRREQEFRKKVPFSVRLTDMQKRLWYAIGLRKEGNLKKASTEFSYIVKKDSTMIEAWYNLALVAAGQKDSSGATKAYTRGVRVAELKRLDHPYLWRDYGLWLYKSASKLALEYLKRSSPPEANPRGM
ncbi:MAG: hypothetical protein HW407_965 [Bacteroidetes bacterium]|nr:hypothetical protein [Bacteroidota bacterium]